MEGKNASKIVKVNQTLLSEVSVHYAASKNTSEGSVFGL